MKNKLGKTKKILIIAVAAVVVICAAAVAIPAAVRSSRRRTLIDQQNYVASKLIELGDYVQGRELALKCDQTGENITSRELIVMADGFLADFETAVSEADVYLENTTAPILKDTRELLSEKLSGTETVSGGYDSQFVYTLDDETRTALLGLLGRVQDTIKVKKSGTELQAMTDMLAGNYSDVAKQTFESLDTTLSKKLRTVFAIDSADYEEAYGLAEELFREDQSFENRALIANLAATGQIGSQTGDSPELIKLSEQLADLDTEYYSLKNEYADEEDAKKRQKLENKISELETKRLELSRQISASPVKRAINFIETTTPASERRSSAYKLELAYLCFLAGDSTKSRDQLVGLLSDTSSSDEPTAMTISSIVNSYRKYYGSNYGTELISRHWKQAASLLSLINSDISRYQSEYLTSTFYDFLLDVLDQLFHGLIIRSIDTTDFPTVRVTVNVASDDGQTLKAKNFRLFDMDDKVNRLTLLDINKVEKSDKLSLMLVVDHSGSMGGKPMSDTKAAVISFVKSLDAGIDVGLVKFDSYAELVAPLSKNRTELLIGVDTILAEGGTSIQSGLRLAGDQLIGTDGRKVIILLSDGCDGDTAGIDAALETLRMNNIYVYTIGFGGADTKYLSYIADQTGGKYVSADSSGMLSEVYSSIGQYMTNDYIIEFKADTQPDEYSRHLSVEVNTTDAVAESDYDVGVSYDEIALEEGVPPRYDCFRQIGGSDTR